METKEKALREEYESLKKRLEYPGIYSTPDYPKIAKRQKELENIVSLFDDRLILQKDLKSAREMLGGGERDPDLAVLALEEVSSLEGKIANNEALLNEALLPKDANDDR